MTRKWMFSLICFAAAFLNVSSASQEASDTSVKRQISTQTPLLPTVGGGFGSILPVILPIVLLLGIGAFILPAIGLLLFGGAGAFGGLFDGGYSKKRSFNMKDYSLISPEKILELLHAVTKAIEEVSKET